ncbi:MAG: type II secretion system F family protein [Beijerinckiaceae bacterium]
MDTTIIAVAVLAAISVGAVFYALVYPYLSGEARAEKRISEFAAVNVQKRAGDRLNEATAARKKNVSDSLKELEQRDADSKKVALKQRIERAGLAMDEKKFYTFSAIGGVGLGAFVYAMTDNAIAGGLAVVVGGLGIPNWALSFLMKRRIKRFIEEFPNAIDIIVRGIKSGLPLADCLRIIASEAREPLKSEFRAIVEAQTMGLTMGDACQRMTVRMPIQEANFFAIVIQIQQKAGGNLSEALANLSKVLRDRKRMKGKIAAMSMEAKVSAVIIGSLPFVVAAMLSASSPDYLAPLFQSEMGHLLLLGSAFWMSCGIIIMRYMINFDI